MRARSSGMRALVMIYRVLLRVHPHALRKRYGREMIRTFEEVVSRAGAGALRTAAAEYATLVARGMMARLPRGATGRRDERVTGGGGGMRRWMSWTGTVRGLVRRPGTPAAIVCTLTMALALEAAVLAVYDTVIAAPDRGGEIVELWTWFTELGDAFPGLNGDVVAALRDAEDLFVGVEALWPARPGALTDAGTPRHVGVAAVTPGLFKLLGVTPAIGPGFSLSPEASSDQILLSYDLWRRRYGADRGVIGGTVELDGAREIVVGILPRGFTVPGTGHADVWQRLVLAEAKGSTSPLAVARLRKTVDIETADAALVARSKDLRAAGLITESGRPAVTPPTFMATNQDTERVVQIAFAAMFLILMVAVINVTGLALTRAIDRRHEWAVRRAVGAPRAGIVAQGIAEGGLVGGVAGLLGGALGSAALYSLIPWIPDAFELRSSIGRTLAVSTTEVGITIASGIAFGGLVGLVATWLGTAIDRASFTPSDPRRTVGPGVRRLRGTLVAGQVALSFILLGGAGLLLGSFLRLIRVDTGYDVDRIVVATLEPQRDRYVDAAQREELYHRVRDRIATLSGVQVVGSSTARVPGSHQHFRPTIETGSGRSMELDGFLPYMPVDADFFRAGGPELLEGRLLADADLTPGEVLVGATMARRLWPTGGALGRRFRVNQREEGPWLTVVGVVEDAAQVGLRDAAGEGMEYYEPIGRSDTRLWERTFLIRTTGDPEALVAPIESVMREVDPMLPFTRVTPLDRAFGATAERERFFATIVSLFGALALTLTSIGLYALLSHHVGARTREIGVRVALGADRRSLLSSVVGRGIGIAAVGIGIGVIGARFLFSSLDALLFGLGTTDPVTFVATAVLFLAVAVAASLMPAGRAIAVDPTEALRSE